MDAAKHQSSLAEELANVIDQLHGLFDDIGLNRTERDDREASVYQALNDALQSQLRLMTQEKDEIREECQLVIRQICQMERSLADGGETDERRFRITTPLLQCLQELKEKHKAVKRRHSERYEQVKKLVEALEAYAARLEPDFVQIQLPPVSKDSTAAAGFDLSHAFSERLEEEFSRVYQEYQKRLAIVQNTAKEVINLYSELGVPTAQIDRNIIDFGTSDPEKLGLEYVDMDRLKDKKQKLVDERERRRQRCESLKEEITQLWEKLGMDENDTRKFLAQHRGYDLRCIRELENELERLLELKRENLHVFVEDCREQIKELWEQLYFSREEIEEFTAARSNVFTDALLQTHEMEIARLQDMLHEREPILQLVHRHKELLNEKKELEISSQDASRLLGRGRSDPGKLLREEKMRKRIAKELPKVEIDLKKALEEWDEEYGCPFTVHGQDYLEELLEVSAVANSRSRTPGPGGIRGRANTIGGGTSSARARSKSRAAAEKAAPPRSKTPTLRPKTPISNTLYPSGGGTLTRSQGRGLASAASNYSNASSVGRSNTHTGVGLARPKTPGLGQRPPTAAAQASPTRIARPAGAMGPPNTTGTVGRNTNTDTIGRNHAIKRQPAVVKRLGDAPKMQNLLPAMNRLNLDESPVALPPRGGSRMQHRPASNQDYHPHDQMGHSISRPTSTVSSIRHDLDRQGSIQSIRSIRSITPDDDGHSNLDNFTDPRLASENYQVYSSSPRNSTSSIHSSHSVHSVHSTASSHVSVYDESTPRPANPGPQQQLQHQASTGSRSNKYGNIRVANGMASTGPLNNRDATIKAAPPATLTKNNSTASNKSSASSAHNYRDDDRKYSNSTISTSNSAASENWETFGEDSDVESMDEHDVHGGSVRGGGSRQGMGSRNGGYGYEEIERTQEEDERERYYRSKAGFTGFGGGGGRGSQEWRGEEGY